MAISRNLIRVQFEGSGRRATRVESITGTMAKIAREIVEDGEKAVQTGVRKVTNDIHKDWRADVGRVLGMRMAKAIRKKVFPERGRSLNAAGLVWAKSPKILDAHERGAIVRGRNAFWLAIPTEAAGRSGRLFRDMGNGQFAGLTPARWENATGQKLRFVERPGRAALLVMDQAKLNKRGQAIPNRRRVRKDGIRTTEVTVPIFVLVKQARVPKRLRLYSHARSNLSKLPHFIAREWG